MVDWDMRTELYDVKQAAYYLRLTKEAVRELVNHRELKTTNYYGRCRFTKAQLDRWLQRHPHATMERPVDRDFGALQR